MRDVVSMGDQILRLGIGLQAISFDHGVRTLHRLSLNIFRTSMLFTHAVVPFAFRLEVSVMIQEFPSSFFPTASGISDRVTRRTGTLVQGLGLGVLPACIQVISSLIEQASCFGQGQRGLLDPGSAQEGMR
jgi:hypothetical protein